VSAANAHQVRIWEIHSTPVRLIAPMPCAIFHVVPSMDGAHVAVDCKDGHVRIWSRASDAVSEIYRHPGYSFGLQWVRGLICSGGWGDGRVVCSNLAATTHEVMETGSSAVSAMATTPDHALLVFAGDDGRVWRSGDPVRELYTHDEWVAGVAISADGRLLASGSDDGSLVVFDLSANRQLARMIAHAGPVRDVSWVGDELWSSGGEGTLKRWKLRDGELRLQHVVQLPGALRLLKVVGGGWAAAVGTNDLLVSRDGASVAMRLDAGKSISALDFSSDQRYVAAVIPGEIILVDLERSAVATLPTGATVQQVRFLEAGLLAFSEPTALKTVRVDQLAYVPYVAAPERPNRASF
jgi:WD40 repeat protein